MFVERGDGGVQTIGPDCEALSPVGDEQCG